MSNPVKTDIKVSCSGCGKEIKIHIGSLETMNSRVQALEDENQSLKSENQALRAKVASLEMMRNSGGADMKMDSFFDALLGGSQKR